MKNFFALLAMTGMLTFGASKHVLAQDVAEASQDETTRVEKTETTQNEQIVNTEETEEAKSLHKLIKEKFIEGGAGFMSSILACLIFGLAIALERIIYLTLATTNSKKLLESVESALADGGVDAAKEVCRNTRGPVASIFFQGLDRVNEGIDVVEKSVISYGSIQMGLMEKGLTWISLFISIAPMLGFLGTVIGMVQAFDAIQQMGQISPTAVAGGIKVALITTVGGLIVAIILQLFYNYILSKIDALVNSMEDASITLVDLLVRYNAKK